MHAVGQQSTVETLLITVAKQRNNGSDQRFLWGPFSGYITDGSNSCCRVSWQLAVTWTVPVTSEYSGRAAVFREELQSCRRTDPAVLKDRKLVKTV
jgi:hypothetical protein